MTIEKYTNDYGKECFRGVEYDTPLEDLDFHFVPNQTEENVQKALHTNLGSITILDRMTGFGWRDTETGYRDTDGKFWLASGMFDVRYSGITTIGEAIEEIKRKANNCKGI